MNQWRKQIEHFSPHRSCILLDYRGHQRSAFPSDEKKMNISALAKDVLAVLKSFELDRPVHIWGHSMGCNVALEAALAEPERFRSLVMCCGTLDNPFEKMFRKAWTKEIFMRILSFYENYPELYVRAWKKILIFPELTKIIATYAGFNPLASNEEDTEAYTLAITKVNPKTFFPLISELTKGMSHAIAPKVQTPALIVAGGYDKVTPPESQKKFSRELPQAKYVEIPAGSHNVQLDFGEYVCMKAQEFWKRTLQQSLLNANMAL